MKRFALLPALFALLLAAVLIGAVFAPAGASRPNLAPGGRYDPGRHYDCSLRCPIHGQTAGSHAGYAGTECADRSVGAIAVRLSGGACDLSSARALGSRRWLRRRKWRHRARRPLSWRHRTSTTP